MSAAAHDPRFDELLPAYALGALEGDELELLEGHLASGCVVCTRSLAAWTEDLARLAAQLPPATPSEATRRAVLARVGSVAASAAAPEPARPRRRSRALGWTAAAAAAVLALAVWGGGARREAERLRAENRQLAAALSAAETAALERSRQLAPAVREILASPRVSVVVLAGGETAAAASGRTFVDRGSDRALFLAGGLPPLDAERTYQLWLITEAPISAGVFEVDAGGIGALVVDGLPGEEIAAWAVTVEPAGGVVQPTGEMVLSG